MVQRRKPTAWLGWVYFAGSMLLVVGGVQIISGLVGIFHKSFYAVSSSGLVAFNYAAWGWINLILGAIVLLTGLGVWAGSAWARTIAVFLAVLVMIDNVAFITAYPLWSIIALIINGFIIYALTMHGDEARLD